MGLYLNPLSRGFLESIQSEIYIDKTSLIAYTNRKINTKGKYLCVSRPRRFGKTMAAEMLAAYYTSGEETDSLFNGLKIQQEESYRKHLNQYDVFKLDMQFFMTNTSSVSEAMQLLTDILIQELKAAYPGMVLLHDKILSIVLTSAFLYSGRPFVFLIDEWDCFMRRSHDGAEQKIYLDFLRNLLKDQPYVALAYMTGILPIKKYGEHSTLNMFYEYSMIDSAEISDCFGFTAAEVQTLCEQYHMDFGETRDWYDGYHLVSNATGERITYSMYSPKSITEAMLRRTLAPYWNQTETYEALKKHIQQNFDGLQDDVVTMLAGGSVEVHLRSFQNDMNIYNNKHEVLTLLVHLGYLAYDLDTGTVRIPNKEVMGEFVDTIQDIAEYSEVSALVQASRTLLSSLWKMEGDTVATGVEKAHMQFPSIQYNNENALSCVIELAFFYAREYYTVIRELPTGKGFADICYIPKPKHTDKSAVIVELKWNQSADTALDQIRRREYPAKLAAYHGNLLLCGINYDREDAEKKHRCRIEKFSI